MHVRGHGSADEPGGGGAGAVLLDGGDDGAADLRVIGQAQVVVAAEKDFFGAVGHADDRSLRRIDRHAAAEEVFGGQLGQMIF